MRKPKQLKATNTLSQMTTNITNAVIVVKNHIKKRNLIGRILLYFLKNDIMSEIDYIPLLKCSNRKNYTTKFRSGHCGAVHSLKNTTRPWLARHQSKLGNIINEESNGNIRITRIWKKIISDAIK